MSVWTVRYTRIDTFAGLVTSTVRTESRVKAYALYWWWNLQFCANPFSVKRVGLYRSQDGVVYFESRRGVTQNAEELRRLRCGKRSRRWF